MQREAIPMSDIYLHHDLYLEASRRRSREAETWSRDRMLQRAARTARTRRRTAPRRRTRLIAIASPMMLLAAVLAGGILR